MKILRTVYGVTSKNKIINSSGIGITPNSGEKLNLLGHIMKEDDLEAVRMSNYGNQCWKQDQISVGGYNKEWLKNRWYMSKWKVGAKPMKYIGRCRPHTVGNKW